LGEAKRVLALERIVFGFVSPKRARLFFAAQAVVGMVVMNAVIQGIINRSIGSHADPGRLNGAAPRRLLQRHSRQLGCDADCGRNAVPWFALRGPGAMDAGVVGGAVQCAGLCGLAPRA